jgi:hypothetical protein
MNIISCYVFGYFPSLHVALIIPGKLSLGSFSIYLAFELRSGNYVCRVLKVPVTDVIYRTLTDNLRTVGCQKQSLEKLKGLFSKRFLHGSQLPWNTSAASDLLVCCIYLYNIYF